MKGRFSDVQVALGVPQGKGDALTKEAVAKP
jgi:hypothetical protein